MAPFAPSLRAVVNALQVQIFNWLARVVANLAQMSRQHMCAAHAPLLGHFLG